MESPDKDPLAPLVAALVLGTILAFLVSFVLVTGGGVAPRTMWGIVVKVAPWYLAAGGTLFVARWLGRRKRR